MKKYDCDKCIHSRKGGVFNRNKKCANCTIDTKDMNGKPSNFKAKEDVEKL